MSEPWKNFCGASCSSERVVSTFSFGEAGVTSNTSFPSILTKFCTKVEWSIVALRKVA